MILRIVNLKPRYLSGYRGLNKRQNENLIQRNQGREKPNGPVFPALTMGING